MKNETQSTDKTANNDKANVICCKCCNCHKCHYEIKVGCLVRYNEKAQKQIATVIGYGNPAGRVTKIEERAGSNPLVSWGVNNCSDITWLQHL